MTAEIINLRRARKNRDRAEREKTADANRIAFGRTRAEKDANRADAALEDRRLDGHRRSRDPDDESGA